MGGEFVFSFYIMFCFWALFLQYWPYVIRTAVVARQAVTIISDRNTS